MSVTIGTARGFTIVELLIVIVVIGILAAITIVAYNGIQQRAVVASLTTDLDGAFKSIKLFQVDNSAYPATINCAIADSTTNKCIKSSSGTVYQYVVSVTPQLFCITATNNSQSYSISQDTASLAGFCPVLRLDAGNTVSYPGTGTSWTDLSGSGNTGTLINGVGYSGANTGVLSFDGTNDYVALANDIISTANIRANGATYAAWVKSTNTAAEQRIVGQKPSVGYFDYASGGLGISTSHKAEMIAYDDNVSYKYAIGNTSLQDGTWYFIVGTYDASDKNIRIYVNGMYDGSSILITTFSRLESNAENIAGAKNTLSALSFNGLMAGFTVYNKTLTTAEIQQNFNSSRGRYGI